MKKSILSTQQKKFLALFPQSKLSSYFYLSGGTALTEFYIPYRYSEDLDFFSEKEFDLPSVTIFLKNLQKKLGYKKIDINTSFNRNIIQLIFEKNVLKLEFTYYPFPQIESPRIINGVKVDSLLDIAVNKLFTIYQMPRSRDFIDLYMIHRKKGYEISKLIMQAKRKFDWHVDSIKLGAQFLLSKKVKDYPRLIEKVDHKDWQNYFLSEAKKLEKDIFKKDS